MSEVEALDFLAVGDRSRPLSEKLAKVAAAFTAQGHLEENPAWRSWWFDSQAALHIMAQQAREMEAEIARARNRRKG